MFLCKYTEIFEYEAYIEVKTLNFTKLKTVMII